MNLTEKILYLITLPIVALSFILIPFTNDVRIFQGVARLVDYYGMFPSSLDAAWEIKPLGNRLINYLLYKAGSLVAEFGSPQYAIFVKAMAVIFALLCCYYFARTFKDQTVPIFAITTLAMLTAMNFLDMQAEWYAVLFSLVALGLLLDDSTFVTLEVSEPHAPLFFEPRSKRAFLAGAIFLFIFLLKGISGLLVVSIMCAAFIMIEDRRDFYHKTTYAVLGFFAAGVIFLIMCLTIFPHALADMQMSAALARVGQYPFYVYMNSLFEKLFTIAAYVPALLFAFVVGFSQIASNKLPKLKYAAYLLMWLVPFAIIYIQGEFFIYHYFVLVFPGIIAVCLEAMKPDEKQRRIVYSFCIVGMLLLWLVFNSSVGYITSAEVKFYESETPHAAEANALFHINNELSVLFLDPGAAPYFFLTNSSCRYSTPLPVQRDQPDWNISYLPAYAEEYSCIMNYQGNYIVGLDGWFGKDLPERAEIYKKFNTEYHQVYNQSWDIWEKNNKTGWVYPPSF